MQVAGITEAQYNLYMVCFSVFLAAKPKPKPVTDSESDSDVDVDVSTGADVDVSAGANVDVNPDIIITPKTVNKGKAKAIDLPDDLP